jgi:hypothetical protein
MEIRSILAAALVTLLSINAGASGDDEKKDDVVVEQTFSTDPHEDEDKDETVVVEPDAHNS